MGVASLDFIEYLNNNNIKVVDSFENKVDYKLNITEDEVLKQLIYLKEFHKRSMGFEKHLRSRLSNKIGREIEEYKVSLRRFTKDIERIWREGATNDFEKTLSYIGEDYINRGEKSLEIVNTSYYVEIILRSMRRKEVCLQNLWINNLTLENNTVKIKEVKDICYNLVEMDLIYLIKKLRREGHELDWSYICKKFCDLENIDDHSEDFIISLASYPTQVMRCCDRYRENKKNWSFEKYEKKLRKAMKEDGKSLI